MARRQMLAVFSRLLPFQALVAQLSSVSFACPQLVLMHSYESFHMGTII